MAERAIVEQIERELKKRDAWYVKTHGAGVSRNGIPDLLCCLHGQFVALEVKQPGRQATPLQRFELERLRRAGAHAHVVTSITEARAVLDLTDRRAA